jgi:hypothetical protein
MIAKAPPMAAAYSSFMQTLPFTLSIAEWKGKRKRRIEMAKPYKKLRMQMYGEGVDQNAIADCVGRSRNYVSMRMRGECPWDMGDVYRICDLLEIPLEEIPQFFPREDSLKGA